MYLHEDKELFRDIVEQVSAENGRTPMVIEKDYYVTMILKLLAEQLDHTLSLQRLRKSGIIWEISLRLKDDLTLQSSSIWKDFR